MIYTLLKRMITTGNYEKENMQNKLNIFYAVNQLTDEQYLELTELINPEPVTKEAEEDAEKSNTVEENKQNLWNYVLWYGNLAQNVIISNM